jgi:trans-aconitate methyltransferase
VLDLAGSGAGRRALDLGGGAGVETQAILGRGWEVLAIDYDPEAADFASTRLTNEERGRLTFRTEDFREINELPPSDLVHAAWSLPFAGDRLDHLWGVALEALNPGGWLACELFGIVTRRRRNPDVATLTMEQVDRRAYLASSPHPRVCPPHGAADLGAHRAGDGPWCKERTGTTQASGLLTRLRAAGGSDS